MRLLACLRITASALMLVSLFVSSIRADAAGELDAAFAKLRQTAYRRRDITDVPAGVAVKVPPVITECSGDVERMVFDLEIPSIGQLTQERIKARSRAAIRTTSPALVAKFSEMNRTLTISSARRLLQQIVSVASAVGTGGLSTASWIKEAAHAAVAIKTTADARGALQRAAEGFGSWQLLEADPDDDPPAGSSDAGTDTSGMTVERESGPDSFLVRYVRRPAMTFPGASFHSVVTVNTTTGFPVAEENYVNGRRILRTEFFDVGAPIAIQVPDCLK